MKLHHERVTGADAAPERWILFLHGIYGAGRNWASVARRVVERRPDWGVVLVDLRQHGRSTGFPPPHTLTAAADDIRALVEDGAIAADAVLGHSFGGKVALVYSQQPAAPLRQLWVVDSTPGAGPPSESAWEVLEVLRSVPTTFPERAQAVLALEREGIATPTAQWIATNLVRSGEGSWRWRIDPDDMEALLRDFFRTDAWDTLDNPPPDLEVHVVKAERSAALDEDACSRVADAGRRTGHVHLHRVDGGHWVNADNPDALVALLSTAL